MTVFSRFLGKGLAFPVSVDPATGGLVQVSHEDNIKSCVLMFLSTRQGERVLLEGYGLPEILFENIDVGTADVLEYHVQRGLAIYEPRVRVTGVVVRERTTDRNVDLPGITMVVNYIIRSTGTPDFVAYQIPAEGFSG